MTILTKENYEPLTESSAVTLAIKLRVFPEGSVLQCREIGDGNLNLVFRVTNQHGKGIIIKQALPYAKVVGESWPLTLKRATIEKNALHQSAQVCSEFVPKVFYSDEDLAITVMEDLSHLRIVRSGLIHGDRFPLLAEHIGEYLAKTLFFSSDFGMNQQEKKELQKQFVNPELCKITEDLVLTDPFFPSETNNFEIDLREDVESLWSDTTLQLEVAKLKYIFLTRTECLLHGDLHTGSIFASASETKVIDPEFAFFGPFGFDIGQFFANLLLNALSKQNLENKQVLLRDIETTWNVFCKTFEELWITNSVEHFTKTEGYFQHVLNQIFTDSIGFAGCEIIRRTIGLAHVADLDGIENVHNRITAKKVAIYVGRSLVTNRNNINSIEQLVAHYLNIDSHHKGVI
ncbi:MULTISPECIES: S-methyl-5-thioribose kinase [Bacillus]|uniref:S-methyl-5-thioribose kinase n=1 Tax=Bacillus TaxID=1386 RepID=UPI000BB67FB5|nr:MULTISPECIES: S-methyl-5-thioribose kinase [Bacillus]